MACPLGLGIPEPPRRNPCQPMWSVSIHCWIVTVWVYFFNILKIIIQKIDFGGAGCKIL